MPILIRKLPNKDLYRVYNKETKEVHSYATTLENAKKQVKLLQMIDAGVPLSEATFGLKNVSGKGLETDLFDNDKLGNPVSIPEINSIDVTLPTYMYKRLPDIKKKDGTTKPPQYRFRLVTPTTKARNLASRMKQNVVNLERKPVASPSADIDPQVLGDLPKLKDFSPADREKIDEYYKQVKEEEGKDKKDIANQPANNRQRGFPLPCDKQSDGAKKVKPKATSLKTPKEKKPVGRPKKQQFKEIILQEGDVVFPDESSLSSSSKSKSSKSSQSVKSLNESELGELYMTDKNAFNKYLEDYEKKGKGLTENKILTKSIGMNSWVQYVKDYASKNGMKYNEALKDPACKAGYKSGKGLVSDVKKAVKKVGLGIVDEAAEAGYADQALIANAYNQKNLGAQKKYITL